MLFIPTINLHRLARQVQGFIRKIQNKLKILAVFLSFSM